MCGHKNKKGYQPKIRVKNVENLIENKNAAKDQKDHELSILCPTETLPLKLNEIV